MRRYVISGSAKGEGEETDNVAQYHGGMSLQRRDETIEKFKVDTSIRVLLASLKCGGGESPASHQTPRPHFTNFSIQSD